MFLKLLKYDFLDNFFPILFLNALIIFSALILRFCAEQAILFGMFLSIFFFSHLLLGILTLIVIVRTIDTRLFSNERYLTFSLPVKIDLILISKILVSMLWIFIGIFVITFLLPLISMQNLFGEVARVVYGNVDFFAILNSFLSCLGFILVLFLALTLINVFKINRFKFLIGFGIYAVIMFVLSIIALFWSEIPLNDELAALLLLIITNLAIYFLIRFLIINKILS